MPTLPLQGVGNWSWPDTELSVIGERRLWESTIRRKERQGGEKCSQRQSFTADRCLPSFRRAGSVVMWDWAFDAQQAPGGGGGSLCWVWID